MRVIPLALLTGTVLVTSAISTCTAAYAQPVPCAGYAYQLPSGAIACAPLASMPVQVPPPPAEDTAPRRSLLDRLLGRNRPAQPAPAQPASPAQPAPVFAVPPAQPAPPAPSPADTLVGPVLSPGDSLINLIPGGAQCSPGAVVTILGETYTCPPTGIIPASIIYPRIPGQPPAAGAVIQPGGFAVTH